MRQTKTKKRGGFTLMEVILAIVALAVIMGIVIPKIMSSSDQAQIKQVISSDVKSIIRAAADWRRTSATAGGTYTNIAPKELDSRLPSNMELDDDKKLIKSSGLNGGCTYDIAKSTIENEGDSFVIGVDCTKAAEDFRWKDKLKKYAVDAFKDTVMRLTSAEETTIKTDNNDPKLTSIDCSTTTTVGCVDKVVQ